MLGIRKYFKGDPVIWLIATLLTLMGLLAVYSATGTLAYANNRSPQTYLFKQLFLAALGFGIMWLAHLVNFQYYSRVSQILILISIPYLLTLRIIPKAILVNNSDVPPKLTMGKVNPVTGNTFTLTPI